MKGPKAVTREKRSPVVVPKVIDHVKDLVADPENRRRHNPRNIGMVVDALHHVGASRSIVIDERNVVLAGNGVTEAAAQAGITKLKVVDVDGETIVAVRRTGLTAEQKRALAIYDNRTAELAEWAPEQLQADVDNGLTLEPWFTEKEAAKVLGTAAPNGGEPTIPEAYQVLVTCKSETDQGALLERMTEEGYECRALMS